MTNGVVVLIEIWPLWGHTGEQRVVLDVQRAIIEAGPAERGCTRELEITFQRDAIGLVLMSLEVGADLINLLQPTQVGELVHACNCQSSLEGACEIGESWTQMAYQRALRYDETVVSLLILARD